MLLLQYMYVHVYTHTICHHSHSPPSKGELVPCKAPAHLLVLKQVSESIYTQIVLTGFEAGQVVNWAVTYNYTCTLYKLIMRICTPSIRGHVKGQTTLDNP